jgi:hypothetical protein
MSNNFEEIISEIAWTKGKFIAGSSYLGSLYCINDVLEYLRELDGQLLSFLKLFITSAVDPVSFLPQIFYRNNGCD